MKIVICDDSDEDKNHLKKMIIDYFVIQMIVIEIFEFSSAEELIEDLKYNTYDVFFLDVYMGAMNGIELGYSIINKIHRARIIYTTTSLDFMAQGFDIGAIHYLIKPVEDTQLNKALDRCSDIFPISDNYISIKQANESVNILFSDIIHIETTRNGIIVHHEEGDILSYMSLSQVIEQMKDTRFLQCHRSYVINMDKVSSTTEDYFVLKDDIIIYLRQSNKRELRQHYLNYQWKKMRLRRRKDD